MFTGSKQPQSGLLGRTLIAPIHRRALWESACDGDGGVIGKAQDLSHILIALEV